ncbi:MAG: Z-ring formation inhibitor MciZ [Vulcanibacillus sp.]
MRVIRTKNQIKISGKAWEIKSKLLELSKSSVSLQDYLNLFTCSTTQYAELATKSKNR